MAAAAARSCGRTGGRADGGSGGSGSGQRAAVVRAVVVRCGGGVGEDADGR